MMYLDLSEHVLLKKCSEGDANAYHEIYQRYKRYIYAVVWARMDDKDDAKDITQEIFINLWTFRKHLAGIREIKPYLYTLSRNQVISAYRKRNIRLKGEQYLMEQLDGLQYSAEDQRLAIELNHSISAIVEQLPETMRHCYHLSKNEGKKNGEIALLLDISEKTVRNNISEALKRLKFNLQISHPELLTFFFLTTFKDLFF